MLYKGLDMEKKISIGNLITIIILLVTMSVTWGAYANAKEVMSSQIKELKETKSERAVVNLQFEYVKKELAEIKEILKDK